MERRLSCSSEAILEHDPTTVSPSSRSPSPSPPYFAAHQYPSTTVAGGVRGGSSTQLLTIPHWQGPRSVVSEGRASLSSKQQFRRLLEADRSPSFLVTPPTRECTPVSWSNQAENTAKMTYEHRGELSMAEKYKYDLSKAQLKASSRTSALLAGFAMVALVELQYDEDTPKWLLVTLGVVTALLVSVHLLALMMSTCILPYMEASGATQDSPHIRLKFYIDLSWLFSTCIGLILFLVEIGIIFFVKFKAANYETAGYITTAILVPVLLIFVVISCLIHRSRASHSIDRIDKKVNGLKQLLNTSEQNLAMLKIV